MVGWGHTPPVTRAAFSLSLSSQVPGGRQGAGLAGEAAWVRARVGGGGGVGPAHDERGVLRDEQVLPRGERGWARDAGVAHAGPPWGAGSAHELPVRGAGL